MRFFISRYRSSPKRKISSIAPARARGYYGRPRTEKKPPPRWLFVVASIVLLLSIAILVVPVAKPNIDVPPHLEVSRVQSAVDDYFRESLIKRPFRRSPIFFSAEGLAAHISTIMPTFIASVERSGGRSYMVRVQDRIPTAHVIIGNNRYVIDRDGVVLTIHDRGVAPEDTGSLPLLYLEVGDSVREQEFGIGRLLPRHAEILRAFAFYRRVGELVPLQQAQLSMVREPWQFELGTLAGWKLFLLFDEQLEQQYERFVVIHSQQFKEAQPSHYVDLRYGNRVYYQ